MDVALFLVFVTAILATSHADSAPGQIGLLRLRSSAGGVNCRSWRLAVETNNLQKWTLVPQECKDYVGRYMLGKGHPQDCEAATAAALEYAKSLKLAGDGKDVWVFDIDQTALSLLPYYTQPNVAFGSIAYNGTMFEAWLAKGLAPPVPAVLKLYKKLITLGFKIVFISGTSESQRDVRVANLNRAGYYKWEKLILKEEADRGTTAQVYKTKKRTAVEAAGYRILGNMGDQWSDITGTHVGNRTFKLPNPMFYIS